MHYSQLSSEFSSKFFELVKQANKIVITAHKSPDGDAFACVLSVYEILSTNYPQKKIRMVFSSKPEDKFNFLKNYEQIEFVTDLADEINGTDLLIMLDGGQFNRFTEQPEKLKKEIANTICIDHHSSPIDEFSLSFVSAAYPDCAEMVYLSLCEDFDISSELAQIFLLGILEDTGNFAFLKPNQTETLSIAKKLLEISKIEIQEFRARYRTIPKRVFEIMAEFVKNAQFSSIETWPGLEYSFISRDFKNKGQYSDSEVSDASHIFMSYYLGAIEEYPWGFVITPKENGSCNISTRSLPKSVSARDVMERMGIGGGHDRAAGGNFKKLDKDVDPEDCIKKILEWIENNKPVVV